MKRRMTETRLLLDSLSFPAIIRQQSYSSCLNTANYAIRTSHPVAEI